MLGRHYTEDFKPPLLRWQQSVTISCIGLKVAVIFPPRGFALITCKERVSAAQSAECGLGACVFLHSLLKAGFGFRASHNIGTDSAKVRNRESQHTKKNKKGKHSSRKVQTS